MTLLPSRMGLACLGMVPFLLTGCMSEIPAYLLADDDAQKASHAKLAELCPALVPKEMYYLTPSVTLSYDNGTLSAAFDNTPFLPLKKISKEEQPDYLPYIFRKTADYRGLIIPRDYPRATLQLIAIEKDNCLKIGPENPTRYERRSS